MSIRILTATTVRTDLSKSFHCECRSAIPLLMEPARAFGISQSAVSGTQDLHRLQKNTCSRFTLIHPAIRIAVSRSRHTAPRFSRHLRSHEGLPLRRADQCTRGSPSDVLSLSPCGGPKHAPSFGGVMLAKRRGPICASANIGTRASKAAA